jgi:hypothetical protein
LETAISEQSIKTRRNGARQSKRKSIRRRESVAPGSLKPSNEACEDGVKTKGVVDQLSHGSIAEMTSSFDFATL